MALNSWLFTFPFWVFVDTATAPKTMEGQVLGHFVRAYPPFRSAPANFPYAPLLDVRAIPFGPGITAQVSAATKLLSLVAVPNLEHRTDGASALSLHLHEEWRGQSRNVPMDSLRLDVSVDERSGPDFAEKLAVGLLQLLRWKSDQWWIMRSVQPLLGVVRNHFPVDERGIPNSPDFIPSPHTSGNTPYGFEQPITQEMWEEVLQLWHTGTSPPETVLILLDAYYFAATGEYRRSVIDAATACEQAKDNLFERKWYESTNEPFRRGRVLSGYDLPDHLSNDARRWTKRSYGEEHPEQFSVIKNLWSARGNIAHGGALTYRAGKADAEVTRPEARCFVDAARHCVAWLDSL